MSSSEPSYDEKDGLATDDGQPLKLAQPSAMSKDGENGTTELAASEMTPHGLDNGHAEAAAAKNVDVEKAEPGQTTVNDESNDPNVVTWDGKDDPANPMNFTNGIKVMNVALVSAICFVSPLASSMFAPGVPSLMKDFHSTNAELGTLVVSIYVLGFAAGPMVLAPMSELYGRLPLYHICNVMFVIFNVACAVSSDLNMLIGFRFLAGVFGSAPLTNGGGTIADLVRQEHRGAAMSSFVIGPLLGPVIGPIAGGYLTDAKGWRWVFWVLSMLQGVFTVLCFIFMRETYAVTLLARKTKRLRKETGNPDLRSKLDLGLTPRDLFWRSIVRPTKMLFLSPIVMSMSLYVGLIYGYLYLLFTTFSTVFEGQYGFSSGSVGLTYIGLGVGSMIGLFIIGMSSDRILKSQAAKSDGEMKPEYRLPLMIYGAIFIPIGLFIYGWTAYYKVHYIVPILGTMLIGIGNLAVFMCVSTYLIDAYVIHAASVLAANTLVRSILGSVLPLAGPRMYQTMGLGWGNSLLGFIAVAALPVPWVLHRYGERMRKRFDLTGRI